MPTAMTISSYNYNSKYECHSVTVKLFYSNFSLDLIYFIPKCNNNGRDEVEPNNTCLSFNNSSCWAQGNHRLFIGITTLLAIWISQI